MTNFHINIAILDFIAELVLVNNVVRDDFYGHSHIFIAIQRGSEVEQLEVGGDVTGIGSANYTIPQYLRCYQVGSASGEFAWVVDEVATDCYSDMIWVFFLWAIVDYNSCIGNCSV